MSVYDGVMELAASTLIQMYFGYEYDVHMSSKIWAYEPDIRSHKMQPMGWVVLTWTSLLVTDERVEFVE